LSEESESTLLSTLKEGNHVENGGKAAAERAA
jgi:hypothetical protein